MTRSASIIEFDPWLETPAGRYLLDWEQAQLDRVVADLFGFHAVQLGWPAVDALGMNRMPHRWLVTDTTLPPSAEDIAASKVTEPLPPTPQRLRAQTALSRLSVVADYDALPFPSSSLDLVVLPHTLELARDPHHTLREVERVLMPEGRLVVLGFNPTSLWGLRQRFGHLGARLGFGSLYLPEAGEFIGYWRLRDWLKLLNFHIEAGRFGCWRPALHSQLWLDRYAWMDRVGDRWWPVLGAVYFLVATKRVHGMRMISPAWKHKRTAARAPAVVTSSHSHRQDAREPAETS